MNKPPRRTITPLVLALIILILVFGAILRQYTGTASTEFISDGRIHYLQGSPGLGFGYSSQENSMQGICFSRIRQIPPSFDLNFSFIDADDRHLLSLYRRENHPSIKAWLKSLIDIFTIKNKSEPDSAYEYLLVKIDIHSYHHGMDDSHSSINDNMLDLVRKKQYISFFKSCGISYIRSISRHSVYNALFRFRLSGKHNADHAFKSKLKGHISVFRARPGTKEHHDAADTLAKEAENRDMKIYINVVGMSPGDISLLIPTDISQFQNTLQHAVKLMQSTGCGIITGIETARWIHHPAFKSSILQSSGITNLSFGQLKRLEENAQFIIGLRRISNEQIDEYFTALLCKKHLDVNASTKKIKPSIVLFVNHQSPSDRRRCLGIEEFLNFFKKHPPDLLLKKNKAYLYGNKKNTGALQCINAVERQIMLHDYRTVPDCSRFIHFNWTRSSFLRHYCPPRIFID